MSERLFETYCNRAYSVCFRMGMSGRRRVSIIDDLGYYWARFQADVGTL